MVMTQLNPLTPKGHKDSKKHGGAIVKHMTGLDVRTTACVIVIGTAQVTRWAHGEVVGLITSLFPGKRKYTVIKLLSFISTDAMPLTK